MRTAALSLGIVGGIFGILTALIALAVGGIGTATGAEGSGLVLTLGWWAFGFCFLGFLGAGLSMAKPRAGALLLVIAGIGYAVSISFFAIITTPLFLIAAVLAFSGRRRGTPPTPATA